MADISKIQIENGVYNIKDETAREDIADLQVPRKIMTNRKIIFIGDSYGTGENSQDSTITTSWSTLVPQYLGLSSNQYYADNENGSGFKAGLTFKSQLERVGANISDKSLITDIIIVGGYNDKDYTISEIDTKMNEFFSYAKTNYPNADFMLACVGWSRNYDSRQSIVVHVIPTYTKCGKYGCRYLKNTEYILHDYDLFHNDKFHPNQNGQNELSSYLTDAILNGSCNVVRTWRTPTYTMGSNMTSLDITSGGFIKENQVNGEITLFAHIGYLTCQPTNFGNRGYLDILNFSNGLIMGSGLGVFPQYQTLFCVDSSNGQHYMNMSVSTLYNSSTNNCVLRMTRQAAGDTISNINAMMFDIIYLKMPALYC